MRKHVPTLVVNLQITRKCRCKYPTKGIAKIPQTATPMDAYKNPWEFSVELMRSEITM